MITVSTSTRAWRALLVSSRNNDSGVVIKMSAGSLANRARSRGGVSPVRTAIVGSFTTSSRRAATRAMPTSGACRLRSTSLARALSGEM